MKKQFQKSKRKANSLKTKMLKTMNNYSRNLLEINSSMISKNPYPLRNNSLTKFINSRNHKCNFQHFHSVEIIVIAKSIKTISLVININSQIHLPIPWKYLKCAYYEKSSKLMHHHNHLVYSNNNNKCNTITNIIH